MKEACFGGSAVSSVQAIGWSRIPERGAAMTTATFGYYYPPGMRSAYRDAIEVTCTQCGRTWRIGGIRELGGFFALDDDDWHCPECGAEAEGED